LTLIQQRLFSMHHTTSLAVHPEAQALIFDLDGTLADTMPAHFMAWQHIAREEGFEFSESLFYEWAGVPTFTILEHMNERYNLHMDVRAVTERKEEAFLSYAETVEPVPQVMKLLKAYHNKLPLACGTGGIRKVAYHLLDTLDIRDVFDAIVTADDVSAYKPAPDTFLQCASIMQVDPRYCQVFEDGTPGIEAAKEAGMIITDIRPFLSNQ